MSGILRLENLNKGTTLKQGDKTVLSYRLSDADGEQLNIVGNTAVARLMHPDFTRIGYESEALTVSADNIVQFSIDSIIPSRLYYLEITVDGQYIFPSRSDEGKLSIDRSSMGAEITIIENAGIDAVVRKAVDLINEDPSLIIDEDKLISEIIATTSVGSIEEYYQEYRDAIKEYADLKPKALNAISKSDDALTKSQNALNVANGIDAKATNALNLSNSADALSKNVQEQFNQVVIDGDSSVEAAQARVDASGQTNATLKARLDKEHNEVTTQLAQTVKKGEAREDTNLRPINVAEMDTETKQLFTGGAVAVVGEDMVGAENIKNSAVNGEHISSDGFSKISALQLESSSHNLIYGADGSKSINHIVSHSGDPYFNLLYQNGVSVINNHFTLSNSNFFFYRINVVDDLKSKGKVSLAVKILADHADFEKQYRFFDSSGSQIGPAQNLNEKLNDWVFVNSVLIPAEVAVVQLRLDARTVPIGTTVAFAFPSVFAGEYVGSNSTNNILDKITDVNKRVDDLQGSGSFGDYPLPKDFNNNGFNLIKKSGAEIGHNHDLSTYTASPDITLFVNTTGTSDTNNGSASSPVRTLNKAWEIIQDSTWNHAVIYVSGEYRRTEVPNSWAVPDGKTLSIVGDGNTLFYAGDRGINYTWTADGETFKTSRSNCNNIIDTTMTADENGIVPPLTKVDSLDEVQTTQGSWYTDNVSVWVRLHDDREPDTKVYSILYNENMRFVIEGSGKVFLSNFQRFGSVNPVGVDGNGTFVQDRLKISCAGHNAQSDGYALLDVKNSFSFDTIIAYSVADGFNYHYANTPDSERRNMLAVEFGCKSYGNGKDAGDQASTSHEGNSVIRSNGTYASDVGAGIADVNGCDSVLVNINASSNLAEGIKVTQDIGIAPVRSTLDNVSAYTASNAIPAFSSEYARVRNSQIYPYSVDKIETF